MGLPEEDFFFLFLSSRTEEGRRDARHGSVGMEREVQKRSDAQRRLFPSLSERITTRAQSWYVCGDYKLWLAGLSGPTSKQTKKLKSLLIREKKLSLRGSFPCSNILSNEVCRCPTFFAVEVSSQEKVDKSASCFQQEYRGVLAKTDEVRNGADREKRNLFTRSVRRGGHCTCKLSSPSLLLSVMKTLSVLLEKKRNRPSSETNARRLCFVSRRKRKVPSVESHEAWNVPFCDTCMQRRRAFVFITARQVASCGNSQTQVRRELDIEGGGQWKTGSVTGDLRSR